MTEQEYMEILRIYEVVAIGAVLLSLFGLVVLGFYQALKGGGDGK